MRLFGFLWSGSERVQTRWLAPTDHLILRSNCWFGVVLCCGTSFVGWTQVRITRWVADATWNLIHHGELTFVHPGCVLCYIWRLCLCNFSNCSPVLRSRSRTANSGDVSEFDLWLWEIWWNVDYDQCVLLNDDCIRVYNVQQRRCKNIRKERRRRTKQNWTSSVKIQIFHFYFIH